MSVFFCRSCTAPGAGQYSTNLTGTPYQLKKCQKHTTSPTGTAQVVSVYDNSTYENYAGLTTSAIQLGIEVVNSRGQTGVAFDAQKRVGVTYVSGSKRVDSAVYVARPDCYDRIHSYPTAADAIRTGRCAKCGGPLTL